MKKWEEEFEDKAYLNIQYGDLSLYYFKRFSEVCKKYIGIDYQTHLNKYRKIKIKARKGCIQIERVK